MSGCAGHVGHSAGREATMSSIKYFASVLLDLGAEGQSQHKHTVELISCESQEGSCSQTASFHFLSDRLTEHYSFSSHTA